MSLPSVRASRAAALAALGALLAAACHRGPSPDAVPRPVARDPLLDPDTTLERRAAPDTFDVRLVTSKGPVVVRVVRAWAPRGADRLFYLVTNRFYDDARFFRVLPRFAAQFGAPGDPRVNRVWETRTIPDDPVRRKNLRGFVSFATAGPNTRTTQLFINLGDNLRLDRMGFAPLGRVVVGLERVDSLYGGYGEGAPAGRGPDQDRIAAEGTRYLAANFPKLDVIDSARVVRAVMAAPGALAQDADETPAADSARAAAKTPAKSAAKSRSGTKPGTKSRAKPKPTTTRAPTGT